LTPRLGGNLGAAVGASVFAVLGLGAVEVVTTAPISGVTTHPLSVFEDGPPPRVTGGFGEDSCVACHWDDENDGVGKLSLSGLPEGFEPGETYRLKLTLAREGMEMGGFQMAIRHAVDTSQAGSFTVPPGEEERIAVVMDREAQFVQHRLAGTRLGRPDTATWSVDWTAPDSPGLVHLHVSALAADGDRSQLGDFVYTLAREVTPAGGAR
jgi:hypothetical protein